MTYTNWSSHWLRFGYRWTITLRARHKSEYHADKTTGKNKKGKTLQPWLLMSLDSQELFVTQKTKTNTNRRNMLCYAILFCTFPEIQGVGYRKNPVWEGRSAFSVRGLEKSLGGMEGKRQSLSYFLSFFLFSPSFEKRLRGAFSSLECRSNHYWEDSNDKRTQDTLVYCDSSSIWCPRVTGESAKSAYLFVGVFVCFLPLTSCE